VLALSICRGLGRSEEGCAGIQFSIQSNNMHHRVAIAFMCLAVGSLLAAGTHAQAPEGPITPRPGTVIQQAPIIKIRSLLVNAPVTVRDAKGEMVNTLEARNFRVTDNGVPQTISHFDLGGDAVSMVVAVETSSRVEPLLPEVRRSGILLTQTVMGPNGDGAVMGFNDSVDKLQDFTSSADTIEKTISRLREGTSGSKLYDAMALGVEMLSGRPEGTTGEPGRRRVLVVIAESDDKGSEAKLGAVLRQAQLQNVTIYSVGLSSTRAELQKNAEYKRPPNPAPDGTFGLPPVPGSVQTPSTENARYGNVDLMALAVWAVSHIKDQIAGSGLQVASAATGGAHMATWKNRSVESAIDEIGAELHSQYVLTYTPTGTDVGGYHEIKVDVDQPGLKVRSRPGYYLAEPES
jgi:VWFA-related protein